MSESVDNKGEAVKSAWMTGPHDTKQEETCGKHTESEYSALIGQLNSNNHEKKSKTIENIYALFPNYAESQMSRRSKKSLFGIVGRVSSWLFGTASEEYLRFLDRSAMLYVKEVRG